MAELRIDADRLNILLSRAEKFGALSGDLSFPVSAIASVQRLDNARSAIRGMRAPGTGWPGRIALGSWRTFHTTDFVAVYRNEPGYVIELTDQKRDRLVLSHANVPELDALISR